ncbi:MAG: hypothetical protein LBP58_04890 [Azoarcus sp.]|jgi:hypothetical protein|nr:hypothetical protein [Azoarcus sp.]
MDTSLQLPSIGLDNTQGVRAQALTPPREREEARTLAPERQIPAASSTRVDISPTAHAAARGEAPPVRPVSAEPAVPVQTSEAVVRADRARDTQGRDTSATVSGQEAVKRYLENAATRPIGQADPSTVRISA